MKKDMKKDIILFVSIFVVLLLISGGTYAYWTWQSTDNPSVVFNTSKGIEEYIEYDAGDSYFVGDFQPSDTYCSGMSNTLSFNLKTTGISDSELEKLNQGILVSSIKMDVNSIESNISASNAVYWVLTSGDSSTCTGDLSDAVAYGTFNGVSSGDVITLLSEEEITTSVKTFTVWIWIDSGGSNLSSLSGETIDVNVWSQIDMLDPERCVIYYHMSDYSSFPERDLLFTQTIVEGESFTIAEHSLYGDSVVWFSGNSGIDDMCTGDYYFSGDVVRLPCGTILYGYHETDCGDIGDDSGGRFPSG